MIDDARAVAANLGSLSGDSTLFVDLADPDLDERLGDVRHVATDVAASPSAPAPWEDAGDPVDHVVLAAPKSRSRLACLVAFGRSRLRPGGDLIVVAPNRGAGVARSVLGEAGEVETLEPKAHRKVFRLRVEEPSTFSLDDWRREARAETAVGPLRLVWYPGVFAEGRLDAASALLLEHLPAQAGIALDVGSGCGVLAAAVGGFADATVAFDSDRFAVRATEATLAANGVAATVRAAGSVPDPGMAGADGYDLVVTNPPFHEGLRTTTAGTERLLREAGDRLTPGGCVLVVANRFLAYERTLDEAVGACELLADDGRYRVWRAWRR